MPETTAAGWRVFHPVCQTLPDAVVWERKALGTQGERDSDAQRCTRGVDGSAPARWHTARRMARCPYIDTSSCEHRRIGRAPVDDGVPLRRASVRAYGVHMSKPVPGYGQRGPQAVSA